MTYSDIIRYFNQLGKAHKDIHTIIEGDYDDILNHETRDGLKYPALWIESPATIYNGDNDHVIQTYDGSLVVLINADPKDQDTIRLALERAFRIARQLLMRMMSDMNGGMNMNIKGKRLDRIQTYGNDYDQGYRLSYVIDTYVHESCFDTDVWDDTVPLGMYIDFKWNVSIDDDDMTIHADRGDDESGWTMGWSMVTNTTPSASLGSANVLSYECAGGDHTFTLILTATETASGVTMVAKAVIYRDDAVIGYSIPS